MEKGQKPSAERKQVLLRISPALLEEITRWADEDFRSVNGQIEYILSDAVKRRRKKSVD